MLNAHVRENRILLAVALSAVLAVGLMATAQLMATPRSAPLLMSVLDTDSQALARSQSHVESRELLVPVTAPEVQPANNDVVIVEAAVEVEEDESIRWFNGRSIKPVRTMRMLVTAYSPDARSCGDQADGITASGYSVWTNGGRMVAADTTILPFGSLVSVPGYGEDEIVPVLDRGGEIKGNRLDVLYSTHDIAKRWGAQRLDVTIWEYADDKPNGFRTQHR
jgi:3D (Asp-Asp-Asp) domain-containing protein